MIIKPDPKAWLLSIPVYLVLIALATFHTGRSIDSKNKVLSHYVSVFALKFNDHKTYNAIEKIYINQVVENRVLQIKVASTTLRKIVFKSFIKFADGEKVFLDQDTDKTKLIDRLLAYNIILKTEIYDNLDGRESVRIS